MHKVGNSHRHVQRQNVIVAKTLSILIRDFLKGYPSSFQNLIVEKVLGDYVLKGIVPKYLRDPRKLKQNKIIVNNLKSGLSNHLSGEKTTLIVMAKNIICIIESSNKSYSSKQVAWVLGVEQRNIKKGIKRRRSLKMHFG